MAAHNENWNGNNLVRDPGTGFLYDPVRTGPGIFTLEKKTLAVQEAANHWPNVGKICDVAGVSRKTFMVHYSLDPVFKDKIDEIRERKVDGVEEVLFTAAMQPKNFMDRIAALRAHRGDIYNPGIKVDVNHHSLDPREAAERRVALAKVIDVDIIKVNEQVLE